MFIYILLAVIFFVFGTLFAFKKGGFLIAGFSSAENLDTKKIYRIMTVTCYINFITSFIGIFVNKDLYGRSSVSDISSFGNYCYCTIKLITANFYIDIIILF